MKKRLPPEKVYIDRLPFLNDGIVLQAKQSKVDIFDVEYIRADVANNQLIDLLESVAPTIRANNNNRLMAAYLMKGTTQESYNSLAESIRLEHKELYDFINILKRKNL